MYAHTHMPTPIDARTYVLWRTSQFFVILVTFLGLAVICDDYFMAALEAIVDYLKLKASACSE